MYGFPPDLAASVHTIMRNAGMRCRETRETLGKAIHERGRDIKLVADQSLEAELVRSLQALLPLPAFSEEAGWSLLSSSETSLHWVIDPLDGTYNYWRGQPTFCIAVAICQGMTPLFGAIYDIANDDFYVGGRDLPATCNDQPIAVSNASQPDQACLMTGLPVGGDIGPEAMSSFGRDLNQWKKVRMIGSAAMSLAHVAAGRTERSVFIGGMSPPVSPLCRPLAASIR